MNQRAQQGRIQIVRDGRIAVLTLYHPPTRNSIDGQTLRQLAEVLTQLRDDVQTGALLLKGSGPHFSSGADIKEPLPTQAELAGQDIAAHPAALLTGFPKPTVTAVHGCCIGGALELALATDIRIAAEDAWFRFAEITMGLPTGWGGATLLTAAVGRSHALDLLLSGRWLDAPSALSMGLVTRTCPAANLTTAAMSLTAELAERAPAAVDAIKAAVRGDDFPAALETEIQGFAAAASRPEAAALINAFLEQRSEQS